MNTVYLDLNQLGVHVYAYRQLVEAETVALLHTLDVDHVARVYRAAGLRVVVVPS